MRMLTRLLLCLFLLLPVGAFPSQPVGAALAMVQGDPEIVVWANVNSGVYHCPGTRWYGKTRYGKYMKQAEARKKGYRPAYGKVCR